MARQTQAPIAEQFWQRWSPRAFADKPVTQEQLASLFEAARWAPSCFNDQPWLFLYGVDKADHDRILSILVPGNQVWAQHAPVLGIVFARRHFAHNGKPNRWGPYDSGAAGFSMALQAHLMGLAVHFMGGIHQDIAYQELQVPEDQYEAMAGFAIGYPGDPGTLPEELQKREQPSDRKPLAQVAYAGLFRSAQQEKTS